MGVPRPPGATGAAASRLLYVDANEWAIARKPYDLRERLFKYEEADDGSSARDRRAQRQIALRELKETSFRLRVLRQAGLLTAAHDPVISECAELVKIVAAVLRKAPRH